jgi:hypothetical protein
MASKGVGWALRMINLAPASLLIGTRPAAGYTVRLEPITSNRSQSTAAASAAASTAGSSVCPKLMVAD